MPSTGIYTLSLHDALPICLRGAVGSGAGPRRGQRRLPRARLAAPGERLPLLVERDLAGYESVRGRPGVRSFFYQELYRSRGAGDRKSTRLNSSHSQISYAVHRDLHSFPTRRSSDLSTRRCGKRGRTSAWPTPATARSTRCAWRKATATGRARSRRIRIRSRPAWGSQFLLPRTLSVARRWRSEEHTSELQSQSNLVCRPPGSTLFPYTTLFRSVYEALWEAGQDLGVANAGYRALDSLRLEKGYRYWSSEISPDTNPFEAGLGFAVSFTKNFIGREALEIGRAHV